MNAWLESATGLALQDPALLLLALLVPLALLLGGRRRARAVVFAPAVLLAAGGPLPATWRMRLRGLPLVLQTLGLLVLVVALARPVRRDRVPSETEGIDLLLCLDTSSSMSADDLEPGRTRLDVAKDAAKAFVAARAHDRIGLVGFARYPDVRCPPTLDHDALGALLAETTTVASDSAEDATGIGAAVARAAQVLRGSASPTKVVILLSDGAENVATRDRPGEIAPVHAAQLCRELGVRVYAVAVGAGDAAGTEATRRLAESTGGRFFAAPDAASVAAVYAAIDALETTRLPEPRYRTEERFAPFLLAGLACVLAAVVARATFLEVLA
jgi:Ca-activated chloride channel homolog